MARRKKAKRSHASYVRAGKKAARTRSRKRRRNPTKHRPVVYSTGRGKSKKLRRSPKYRLRPRRINPKRRSRRRRRNPFQLKKMGSKYFGKNKMLNAVMLLAGLGGSAVLKGMTAKFLPEGPAKDWYQRLYGALSIVLGVTLSKGRRKEVKAASTGFIVFGVYDLIVSNVPMLQQYLPSIASPTAFAGNYMDYGRDTYASMMGAGIQPGEVEVVGANITAGEMPEIVGMDDMDLADALDMAA